MKKKRKRSTSSSTSSDSSSTSSSDDSPSTSRKKSKKRKHKRRRSSRGSKKHKRRMSSCSDKTAEDDKDWFPAPANTSASYINQKQSITKLISEGEESWGMNRGRLEEDADDKHGGHQIKAPDENGQVRNRRDSSSSTQSEYHHKPDQHAKEFASQGRKRSQSERSRNEQNREENDGGKTQQKALPSSLLDIFSQIAEFEKEKKQKK